MHQVSYCNQSQQHTALFSSMELQDFCRAKILLSDRSTRQKSQYSKSSRTLATVGKYQITGKSLSSKINLSYLERFDKLRSMFSHQEMQTGTKFQKLQKCSLQTQSKLMFSAIVQTCHLSTFQESFRQLVLLTANPYQHTMWILCEVWQLDM